MARIALIQMVSSTQVAQNLQQVETLLLQARGAEAQLVVLPENFALMAVHETEKIKIAEIEGQGPIQDKISQLAKRFGLWVVAGTIPIKGEGVKTRASCMVYDEKGLRVARYDKIHLFDVSVSEHETYKESAAIEPGNQLVVVDTPVGRMGLSVCYDLRFPELFQQLLFKGAQLFSVPSAFTEATGLAHWEVLLRARAIENLCYVLAPNQGGHHESSRHTFGHSLVVEPWGKVIAQMDTGPGLVVADIDLHRLEPQYQPLSRPFQTLSHLAQEPQFRQP